MNTDRLNISVTTPSGTVYKWGPDSPDGEDIPSDLSFGTSMPGGFRDMTCSLLRRIDRAYPDEGLFFDVRVYDQANSTVWEGRIAQLPRQHGDSFSVTPGAVGWAANLKDDESFRALYRDIDHAQWQPPSVQRKINLLSASLDTVDPTTAPDDTTGEPSVTTELRSPFSRTSQAEAWYSSRGLGIATVAYAWKKSANIASPYTGFTWNVFTADDDLAANLTGTSNLAAPGPGSGTHTASATHEWAYVRLNKTATTGDSGQARTIWWTHLAVMGTHGLSLQGTEPNAGYYVSDLIEHIVQTGAPLLDTSGITENPTIVPHATFLEPTTPEDAVSTINAYARWDWAVWENRTFHYSMPDPDRLTWRARLSEGAGLDLEGDTAETAINGVVVSYRDASGKQKLVGPTGATTTDDTSDLLADTSSANPANAAGIPRRWKRLDVSVPTTLQGAITIGRVFLAEQLLASRRGTVTLTGTVRHPKKGVRPAWEVRAGDHILIEDLPGDVTRRIISTRYSHQTRVLTAECDNTAAKLDSILARLGVFLTGQGF